ncbi:unnamed protein product, partial [Ixodes pacificus]
EREREIKTLFQALEGTRDVIQKPYQSFQSYVVVVFFCVEARGRHHKQNISQFSCLVLLGFYAFISN